MANFCPECDKQLNGSEKFCTSCGSSVNETEDKNIVVQNQQNSIFSDKVRYRGAFFPGFLGMEGYFDITSSQDKIS